MTDALKVAFSFEGIDRLHNQLAAAGAKAPQAIRRAVNRVGDTARVAVSRELAAQTGLKVGLIKRALKPKRAFDGSGTGFIAGVGSLEYTITARGGDLDLRNFKPVERGGGVTAKTMGQKTFVPGAFKKSGQIGHRRINPKFHGNVLMNVEGGKWGGKMRTVKSGVYIPLEMVSGQSADTFFMIVERDLQNRVAHELSRVLG